MCPRHAQRLLAFARRSTTPRAHQPPTVDRVLFQIGHERHHHPDIRRAVRQRPVGHRWSRRERACRIRRRLPASFRHRAGHSGDPLTISGLTLTHGYGSGVVGGGAIYSKRHYLKVDSSTVSDSDPGGSDYLGGGIRQKSGRLLIRNSTISGNRGPMAAGCTQPTRRRGRELDDLRQHRYRYRRGLGVRLRRRDLVGQGNRRQTDHLREHDRRQPRALRRGNQRRSSGTMPMAWLAR